MALILYLSLRPAPYTLPDVEFFDKVLHFGAYFVLGALLARAIAKGGGERGVPVVMAAFVAAFFFGAIIEALQAVVPGRSADVIDGVANAAGALAGGLLYVRATERRRR